MAAIPHFRVNILTYAPVALAMAALVFGGIFLLNRADAQARDTIRKHHLDDIEQSLYLARNTHGTFPPYNQPTWCGLLNDPANTEVRSQIEAALRQRIEKYANPEKPFPSDPLAGQYDYFYWKRSPAVFELYSILEAAPNGNRNTRNCPGATPLEYDYGLTSSLREDV